MRIYNEIKDVTGFDRTCMLSPCDYNGPFQFIPCNQNVLQNFEIEGESPQGNGLPVPFNHATFSFSPKDSGESGHIGLGHDELLW